MSLLYDLLLFALCIVMYLIGMKHGSDASEEAIWKTYGRFILEGYRQEIEEEPPEEWKEKAGVQDE